MKKTFCLKTHLFIIQQLIIMLLTFPSKSLAQDGMDSDIQIATLTDGNQVLYFDGEDALEAAIEAAEAGDEITLSHGIFKLPENLNKAVSIFGSGYIGERSTVISSSHSWRGLYMNLASGKVRINGCLFENELKIITTGSLSATIDGCFFKEGLSLASEGKSTFLLDNNKIQELYVGCDPTTDVVIIRNSSIYDIDAYESTTQFPIVESCIVYSSEGLLKNSILLSGVPDSASRSILASETYTDYEYDAETDDWIEITYEEIDEELPATDCYWLSTADIYKLFEDGAFIAEFDEDFASFESVDIQNSTFKLTPQAQALYVGVDGTQIGMYGGLRPFTTLPLLPVALTTPANGIAVNNLNIHFDVSGQTIIDSYEYWFNIDQMGISQLQRPTTTVPLNSPSTRISLDANIPLSSVRDVMPAMAKFIITPNGLPAIELSTYLWTRFHTTDGRWGPVVLTLFQMYLDYKDADRLLFINDPYADMSFEPNYTSSNQSVEWKVGDWKRDRKDGRTFFRHQGSNTSNPLKQRINNLPAGNYRLNADCLVTGNATMTINANGHSITVTNTGNAWINNELHFSCTDEPFDISITSEGSGDACITNFELRFDTSPDAETDNSLMVRFPSEVNMEDYINLSLTLSDEAHKTEYVTTSSSNYKFVNLSSRSTYTLTLQNRFGHIFARKEGITIHNGDNTIDLDNIKTATKTTIQLFNADGNDMTDEANIRWFSISGTPLAMGSTITSIPVGEHLMADILMNSSVALHYQQPDRLYIDAGDQPTVTIVLKPLSTLLLTGHVVNSLGSVSGATVTMNQWIGSEITSTHTTTDGNGDFSLPAVDDSTVVSIYYPQHEITTITKKSLTEGSDLGTIDIKSPTGTIIHVIAKLQRIDDGTSIVASLKDLDLEIYNNTLQTKVRNWQREDSYILIPDGLLQPGNLLTLSLSSPTRNYYPLTAEILIDDHEEYSITLELQELGGIVATCDPGKNDICVACLFSNDGALAARAYYNDSIVSFNHLAPGKYTLITLADSPLAGMIPWVRALNEAGMKEGDDYLAQEVTIENGIVTNVSVETVPPYMSRDYPLLSDFAYIQCDKMTLGDWDLATMSMRLDFPTYIIEDELDKVIVNVCIPKGCEFVEHSVLLGNNVADYHLVDEGRMLQVPLPNNQLTERIRFCMIPLVAGSYTTTAFASMTYEGKQRQSPVGSTAFKSAGYDINVPSLTSSSTVTVSGRAIPGSEIQVIDNGTVIGQAIAKDNGDWSTLCTLHNPYNQSVHSIKAIIKTNNYAEFTTANHMLFYDQAQPVPLGVSMSFYNAWYKKDISVYVNLVSGTASRDSYPFYSTTDITFTAHLSDNSPTAASAVNIIVGTNKGSTYVLPAMYDTRSGRWVATHSFEAYDLPNNLGVQVIEMPIRRYDQAYMDAFTNGWKNQFLQAEDLGNQMDAAAHELMAALEADDDSRIKAAMDKVHQINNTALKDIREDEALTNKLMADDGGQVLDSLLTTLEAEKSLLSNTYAPSTNWSFPSEGSMGDVSMPSIRYSSKRSDNEWMNVPNGLWNKEISIEGDSIVLTATNPQTSDMMVVKFPLQQHSVKQKRANALSTAFEEVAVEYGKAVMDGMLDSFKDFVGKEIGTKARSVSDLLGEFKTLDNDYQKHFSDMLNGKRGGRNALERISGTLFGYKLMIGAAVVQKGMVVYDFAKNVYKAGEILGEMVADYQIYEDIRETTRLRLGDSEEGRAKYEQLKKEIDEAQTNRFNDNAEHFFFQCANTLLSQVWESSKNPSVSLVQLNVDKILEADVAYERMLNFQQQQMLLNKTRDSQLVTLEETKNNFLMTSTEFQPILDPSGYVYEAVLSNRLPDVTTTVYERQGDKPAIWQAERYGQHNPLQTDEFGFYAWDVPMGWWQVRYEKAGYETALSEWLPVPPPQLEVNMPMTQAVAPEVQSVKGYESGIKVRMNKYMKPESFAQGSITITRNGKNESDGKIEMLNEEADPYNETRTYASIIKYVPQRAFSTSDNVVLTIHSDKPRSYCDMPMTDDFTAVVNIEPEIQYIETDSIYELDYEASQTIEVRVVPAAAAQGRRLVVKSASDAIVYVSDPSVQIDKHGKATITLEGRLPGTTAVHLQVEDDPDVEAYALTRVKTLGKPLDDNIPINTASNTKQPKVSVKHGIVTIEGAKGATTTCYDVTGVRLSHKQIIHDREQMNMRSISNRLVILCIDLPNGLAFRSKVFIH